MAATSRNSPWTTQDAIGAPAPSDPKESEVRAGGTHDERYTRMRRRRESRDLVVFAVEVSRLGSRQHKLLMRATNMHAETLGDSSTPREFGHKGRIQKCAFRYG